MQILPGQARVKVNLNVFIIVQNIAGVNYHKDWYAHASPLLNDMKDLFSS